jgi:hypothetical protein
LQRQKRRRDSHDGGHREAWRQFTPLHAALALQPFTTEDTVDTEVTEALFKTLNLCEWIVVNSNSPRVLSKPP